jgi:hypothetical protein
MNVSRLLTATVSAAVVVSLARAAIAADAGSPAAEPVAAPRPISREEELLSRLPEAQRTPDAIAMVRMIAAQRMGPNQGWYRPGESRCGWEWLRSRDDADGDGVIGQDEFPGAEAWFARLDRDRSGRIEAADFDWSDASPYMRQLYQAMSLFRRLDDSSDGQLDREEWLGVFERLSAADGTVIAEDLHGLLFPPPGAWEPPSIDVLLAGLISGEIGSHHPGPALGDPAPDFELRTHDGKDVVQLSKLRGRPVVLIFGSFT